MAKKRKNNKAGCALKKTYRGTIRVDAVKGKILITSAFYNASFNTDSYEYKLLQRIKTQNPDFVVEQRTIAKNDNKETYKGLTFAFMEKYIRIHEGEKSKKMKEFKELRLIGECHSKAYQKTRKWFFEEYPDVKNFTVEHLKDFMNDEQLESDSKTDEKTIAA